jgi:hypothetical protein
MSFLFEKCVDGSGEFIEGALIADIHIRRPEGISKAPCQLAFIPVSESVSGNEIIGPGAGCNPGQPVLERRVYPYEIETGKMVPE